MLLTGGLTYDAATAKWYFVKASEIATVGASSAAVTAGADMQVYRSGNTATRLANGQVLIAGGENGTGPLDNAEIYNPADNTFTLLTSTMTTKRSFHEAVLLDDDRILLMGGHNQGGTLGSAEIFDPGDNALNGTFTAIDSYMFHARRRFTAVKLSNGDVLIVGGYGNAVDTGNGFSPVVSYVGEIYDVASGKFMQADLIDKQHAQGLASVAALPDGRAVVMAGGTVDYIQPDPAQSRFYYLWASQKAYIYQPD